MLAFIAVNGNSEHDQDHEDGDSVIKVYCDDSAHRPPELEFSALDCSTVTLLPKYEVVSMKYEKK